MKQQSFPTKTPNNNIIIHAATKLASFKKRKTIDSSGSSDESIGDTTRADTLFNTVIERMYTTQSTMVTDVNEIDENPTYDGLTTPNLHATNLTCASNQTCFFIHLGTPISVTREGRPKLQCINCEGALHSPLCGCFCNRCPPAFNNFLTPNAAEKFENKSSILCHVCHNSISEALK